MAQLPEGSSPNFQEFNAKDLLRLLQTGTWEAKCFVLPEQIVIIRKNSMYIYIIYEKLHTVVSTHLLYVGSNCCKAQGLDESVEDRLNLNTAPQFGTLVVPHCLYKKNCC